MIKRLIYPEKILALPSTLYRFKIDLSDVDRGIYESLIFRATMHPSESIPFFISRILAYCLNYQPQLEFSAGISKPEDPAIQIIGLTGQIELWIDIGNPAAKRIHKASKLAKKVIIYTYKDIRKLAEEFEEEKVYQLETLKLFSIDPRFLNALGGTLARDNQWEMTFNQGELYVGIGKESFQSPIEPYDFNSNPAGI